MQAVRIVPPAKDEDGKVSTGAGTRVLTGVGEQIDGITEMTVRYRPDCYVEAEMTVMAESEEVFALAFMSEASFLAAAKRYGYVVNKKEPDVDH